MSSATIRAGVDDWTGSNEGNTNRGGSTYLVVRDDGSLTNYAYIWLNNPAPRGATVLLAHLKLYGMGTWASKSMRLRPIAATWKESQITYNNAPAVAATGTSDTLTAANTADAQEWSFDVTAMVQAFTDGQANYGFRLAATVQNAAIAKFYSLDSAVNSPVLEVTWSDAPDAPHTLSPSGGRAVSVEAPILRFDYTDVSGSVQLAAVQVQVNNNANQFTTPTFDSGTVAATLPQLDLSATAYVGLDAGDHAWWRVRVQDAAGLWSGWSDVADFNHTAKGTLTLSNPPVGATVTDTTPPIIWALADATQSQWRVQVRLDDDPTNFLSDTGWRSGTANTYTVPAGVLKDQSATYRVVLNVRDTIDRESTPNDPVPYSIGRAFTFTDASAVTGVSGLAAAQDSSGRPWVVLSWTRATAPDQFIITRDGVTVARVAAADVLVSGTSYAYSDQQAAPADLHNWTVRAVVNGVASPAGPGVNLAYRVQGVWLTDLATGRNLPVMFGELTPDMPEVSSTYEPVGSDSVVRIVQTLRGLEGSISGRIIDTGGQPYSYWRSNALIMKKRPTAPLRMAIGRQNLNVLIGNVVLFPLKGTAGSGITFNFWTTDGPQ